MIHTAAALIIGDEILNGKVGNCLKIDGTTSRALIHS